MKKRNDLARFWLEMENELFPALSFDAVERVLYYFFFARTHLLGRRSVRMPIRKIAKATHLSWYTTRLGTLHLRAKGCLHSLERNKSGSVWELTLPRKILGPVRKARLTRRRTDLAARDCFTDPLSRREIFRRERGYCFYCLRKITRTTGALDHVVPRSRGGSSAFDNLVACCQECNSRKRVNTAASFLRTLFRSGRLTSAEFSQRLNALSRLSRGLLRIPLPK